MLLNQAGANDLFLPQEAIFGMGSIGWTSFVINQNLIEAMQQEEKTHKKIHLEKWNGKVQNQHTKVPFMNRRLHQDNTK